MLVSVTEEKVTAANRTIGYGHLHRSNFHATFNLVLSFVGKQYYFPVSNHNQRIINVLFGWKYVTLNQIRSTSRTTFMPSVNILSVF